MDPVEAILFDVGGTLRRGTNRPFPEKVTICQRILDRIGLQADPQEFTRRLDERANAYRRWSRQNLAELNEAGFWTRWMLPERPPEEIAPIAVDLNRIWRHADRSYQVFPEAHEALLGLFRSGYRLGLVSNTTSSVEAPELVGQLGLSGCIECIVLSCQLGIRKPDPAIIIEAARRMQVQPGHCAYIGNLPDRDVTSARKAGFAATIILRDAQKPFDPPVDPDLVPDQYIDNLQQLSQLFPPLPSEPVNPGAGPLYDISMSTMWAIRNFPELNDFLRLVPRLGLASIELNHQVSQEMFDRLDHSRLKVSSIHEPCPALVPADSLRREDILISSPDESRRRQGVESIKRSLDLANRLGASTIVVHPGQVQADGAPEQELRLLLASGKAGTREFVALRDRMVATRAALVVPFLASLKKSLLELIEHARPLGVSIGLENRFHHLDIPSPDEMAMLLALAGPEDLGFIFDAGHAHALDRLGFHPEAEWLERFSSRILGVHLHDALGADDHLPPGQGEIDFNKMAPFIPGPAFRTLEVKPQTTVEQVRDGLKVLADAGCIRTH